MDTLNRRKFLKATGAALVTGPFIRTGGAASLNGETINVAVMGIRSRGQAHISNFAKIPNVNVATICDVDERLFQRAVDRLSQGGKKVKTETDIRRVLDDKDIHAISIAAPDHWHALATIWACQAGKDVYVEKPASHSIWEGRKMVDAARKYNRIVQVGMQSRSRGTVRAAMKFLHEGGIGDIYMAKGLCFKPRDTIGKKPDSPVPPGVHYDLWLGAAANRPFNENRFHYNWHWFWEYGCADLGNQGPHEMDKARWGLNKNEYPVKIKCAGGHFAFDDDQETPNTQMATLEYADGKILQFEVRGLYTNDEDKIKIGNLYFGTKGWMHLNEGTWKTYLGRNNEPGPSMDGKGGDSMDLMGSGDEEGHFENFVKAVRSRKMEDLTGDIETGHLSTALCHLCNISYRVGREVRFDGKSETFGNDSEANALLKRKAYRKPFVVPEKV
ncbi:MAG TPA: Gfo/Idh/MocA family oxidoreductase [Acidobacteriota bacterium]|jgi:predicted dehydrogenase